MAKSATASLITTSDSYCEAVGLSRSRVSTLVFNDGKALDRIATGGDLNTRSYEKAMLWFASNWPEGSGARSMTSVISKWRAVSTTEPLFQNRRS